MSRPLELYRNLNTPALHFLRLAEQAVFAKQPKFPRIVEPLLDAAWSAIEPSDQFFELINPVKWNSSKLQADTNFRPRVSVFMRINQRGNLIVTWKPFEETPTSSNDDFEPRYAYECAFFTEASYSGDRPRGELMYFKNARQLLRRDADTHAAETQILYALWANYQTMLKRLQAVLDVRQWTEFEDVFGLLPDATKTESSHS